MTTNWRDSILFQTLKEINPTEYEELCAYEKNGGLLTEEDKVAKFLYEKYWKTYYKKKSIKEKLREYAEDIEEQ